MMMVPTRLMASMRSTGTVQYIHVNGARTALRFAWLSAGEVLMSDELERLASEMYDNRHDTQCSTYRYLLALVLLL
jgi:hypothetical protein